jgi:hypothetical protein
MLIFLRLVLLRYVSSTTYIFIYISKKKGRRGILFRLCILNIDFKIVNYLSGLYLISMRDLISIAFEMRAHTSSEYVQDNVLL